MLTSLRNVMRGSSWLKQPNETTGGRRRAAVQWLVPLLTLVIALVTFHQYTLDQKDSGSWGCEMSWMTPSYRPIETPDSPISRYRLWLYREAGWDDDTPSGEPVIFVPGNAGSYMQVRSIASSSSRQYHGHPDGVSGDMQGVRKRDFFTVDYNEEFSAFHAAIIRDQARFLAYTIHKVLSLYDRSTFRPTKVTLLGHSMGGIVARLAAMDISDLVDVIFTMSTPHLYPPVTLEYGMESVYETINSQVHNTSTPLLFSICGGVSDSQIVSDACALPRDLVGTNGGFAVFGTGIPGAWTGVDHQAMVWCHQIRWRTARVLLEMTRGGIGKLDVAKKWLLGQSDPAAMLKQFDDESELRYPVMTKNMSIIVRRSSDDPRTTDPPISIDSCDEQGECTPAAAHVDSFPSPQESNAPFPLPGEGVKPREMAYAISWAVPPEAEEYVIRSAPDVEVVIGAHVTETVHGRSWNAPFLGKTTRLTLRFAPFLPNSLKVYKGLVTLGRCTGPLPILRHTSLPRADLVNTTYESRFLPINSETIYLHSHISGAPFSAGSEQGILLDIFQDPSCPIKNIDISISPLRTLAKAVLRYRMLPVPWAVGWAALLFVLQLQIFAREGNFPDFTEILVQIGTVRCLPACLAFTGLSILQPVFGWIWPTQDRLLGISDAQLAPLSTVLATFTLGLVIFVGSGIEASRAFFRRRALKEIPEAKVSEDDAVTKGQPAPAPRVKWTSLGPMLLVLASVYFVVPRQLALVALYIVLCFTYLRTPDKTPARTNTLASILLLWTFLTPFNLVTLGVWARNLWLDWRSSFASDHDIFRVLPLLGVVQLSTLSHGVRARQSFIRLSQAMLLALSFAAFTFGARYTYILPYISDPLLLCLWGILWP